MFKLDKYNDTIELITGETKVILSATVTTGQDLGIAEILELLKQELNND